MAVDNYYVLIDGTIRLDCGEPCERIQITLHQIDQQRGSPNRFGARCSQFECESGDDIANEHGISKHSLCQWSAHSRNKMASPQIAANRLSAKLLLRRLRR